MKTVILIQARMGSTRLPNKMMLSLHGKPIIEWVLQRAATAKLADEVVLATSRERENDILEKYAASLGFPVYRGEENNVLKRFYGAAVRHRATRIVRVCADNPLVDGHEIDNLIEFYEQNRCDYAFNHIPRGNRYPDGLGAEIVSVETLRYLYENVREDVHKEHCFSYIWDNSQRFAIKTFDPPEKELHHPEMRFDVDTFEDYYKLAMRDIAMETSSRQLIKIFGENNED